MFQLISSCAGQILIDNVTNVEHMKWCILNRSLNHNFFAFGYSSVGTSFTAYSCRIFTSNKTQTLYS